MKLIIGLGNPGRAYQGTRHNIGSVVVKALAQKYKLVLKRGIFSSSLSAKARICGQDVVLAIPLSFMNLSGNGVSTLIKKYRIASHHPGGEKRSFDNLLVICDDMDLEFGRIRIRAAGSSGGHNGLKSIINALDSQAFARLRIGIGRNNQDAAGYVLSAFNKRENLLLKEITEEALECACIWISNGIEESMNIFNKRRNP